MLIHTYIQRYIVLKSQTSKRKRKKYQGLQLKNIQLPTVTESFKLCTFNTILRHRKTFLFKSTRIDQWYKIRNSIKLNETGVKC